jgi:hypothetical protein
VYLETAACPGGQRIVSEDRDSVSKGQAVRGGREQGFGQQTGIGIRGEQVQWDRGGGEERKYSDQLQCCRAFGALVEADFP